MWGDFLNKFRVWLSIIIVGRYIKLIHEHCNSNSSMECVDVRSSTANNLIYRINSDHQLYGRQLEHDEPRRCRDWMLLRIAWSLNWMPLPTFPGSISPVSIFARMVFAHFRNDSSTFSPVFALVSRNIRSFSCAKLLASKKVTSRSSSRSFLLPTRMMMMCGLARVRVSLSQFESVLKESREVVS